VKIDCNHSGAASVAASTDGGRRRGEDSILDREVVVQEEEGRGGGGAGRRGGEGRRGGSGVPVPRRRGRPDAEWIGGRRGGRAGARDGGWSAAHRQWGSRNPSSSAVQEEVGGEVAVRGETRRWRRPSPVKTARGQPDAGGGGGVG
jgi:hypothetical protein